MGVWLGWTSGRQQAWLSLNFCKTGKQMKKNRPVSCGCDSQALWQCSCPAIAALPKRRMQHCRLESDIPGQKSSLVAHALELAQSEVRRDPPVSIPKTPGLCSAAFPLARSVPWGTPQSCCEILAVTSFPLVSLSASVAVP